MPPALPAPASFSPDLWRRVISARVRHTKLNVHPYTNARRIGRSLASMRPTWVTGTLRYRKGQYPDDRETRAWNEIRRIVRETSPTAQFDVVLNAEQYRSIKGLQLQMRRLRAKLDPDGWFFDFLSSAHRRHPQTLKAAVANAHAHGEWIGGNIFGYRNRPQPTSLDFLSVQDGGVHLHVNAVAKWARRKPILYHLNSNPQHKNSGGCRFMRKMNTWRRIKHVRRRAKQQVKYNFRVAYPVLYPQCFKPRRGNPDEPILYAYNAFRDPPMADEIRTLLDRYDYGAG